MKKIVALVLCLVMVVGLMAGCQKKMDAETLYQNMNEAMKAITAQAVDMNMDLELKMSTMGISMNMAMGLDLGMQAKSDFSAMHMDMTMKMDAMGQSEEMSVEVYTALEDDAVVSYTYESDTETWIKSVQEGYQELITEFQELAKELGLEESQMPKGTLTLAEDQITVNDRKYYVLTQQVGGEELQSFLNLYMEQILNKAIEESGEELDEESQQMLDLFKNLDWSKLSYTMVYHVDAETFLPLEGECEITGLGETMNGMIETIMAAAMMEMDEETPAFSIEIPTLKLSMSNMAYNDDVVIPAVPQEAIDNAIDADEMMDEEFGTEELEMGNPPQEDGSYLMTMGITSVRITVPAGCSVFMSEVDYLNVMTEDMSEDLVYYVVPELAAEEMMQAYQDQVAAAKDEGRWLSNEESESINGFTVTNIVYNDGVYEVTAWREIPGGLMLVAVTSYDQLPVMDDILNNIEIG